MLAQLWREKQKPASSENNFPCVQQTMKKGDEFIGAEICLNILYPWL